MVVIAANKGSVVMVCQSTRMVSNGLANGGSAGEAGGIAHDLLPSVAVRRCVCV